MMHMKKQQVPFWIWILLACAVLGVSSAGALFQHVDEIPPLLRASWRLQLTAILLAPFAILQWKQADDDLKQMYKQKSSMKIIGLSGLFLAAHFGTWVASLDETSLTHSLLFVTSHPIIIVVGMIFLSKGIESIDFPRRNEIIGAFIGFAGAALTLSSMGKQQGDHTVTLYGDALAFAGGIFVVGYIICGRILRQWMPIFLYAFPVTLLGGVLLIPASYLLEPQFSEFGIFGWTDGQFLPWFLLLAAIAGFLGHTGLNTCLRYVSPLVVSVSVTLEPVLGTIIGWMFFDAGTPDGTTILGGLILLVGLLMVVVSQESDAVDKTNNQK
ncbi:MAG: DMT family transporter [Candidatus Poseidoniales archaeon]